MSSMISIVAGSGYTGPNFSPNIPISPLLVNLTAPSSLTVDSNNDLLIADTTSLFLVSNNEVKPIFYNSSISSMVQIPNTEFIIWGDQDNGLNFLNRSSGISQKLDLEENNVTINNLNTLMSLFYSHTTDIYFIESSACIVRKISNFEVDNLYSSYQITTVAGKYFSCGYNETDSIDPLLASLNYPQSLWLDVNLNLYISDTYNHRIRMINSTTNTINTIVGNGTAGFSEGSRFSIDSMLNYPGCIIGDDYGNLFIADKLNYRIRFHNARDKVLYTIAGVETSQHSISLNLQQFYFGEISSLAFNNNKSLIYTSSLTKNQVYSFHNTFSKSSSDSSTGISLVSIIIALVIPILSIALFACFLRKFGKMFLANQPHPEEFQFSKQGYSSNISIVTELSDIESPSLNDNIQVTTYNSRDDTDLASLPIATQSDTIPVHPLRRIHVQAIPVAPIRSPYSRPPFCSQNE